MPTPRDYRYTERVAWSDTDTAGVAFFGVYARWVEAAEAGMWRAAGIPQAEMFERHDLWLPRVDFHCRYRRPLRHEDPFEVRMHIKVFGRRTFTYAFAVWRTDHDDDAARGELRVAAIDRATLKGRTFPEEIPAAFLRAGFMAAPS